MTGYRLGTAVGPQPLIDAMTRLASSSVTHPCMLSQHAGGDGAVSGRHLGAGSAGRAAGAPRLARSGLGALEGVRVAAPEGALSSTRVTRWLASLGLAGDAELVARLRDEAGLKVLPGSAFGAPGHLRLSFAASRATLEAGLERLRAF